ncbi:hypothetical protein WCP94_002935 [Bilophila wadsworthia]
MLVLMKTRNNAVLALSYCPEKKNCPKTKKELAKEGAFR